MKTQITRLGIMAAALLISSPLQATLISTNLFVSEDTRIIGGSATIDGANPFQFISPGSYNGGSGDFALWQFNLPPAGNIVGVNNATLRLVLTKAVSNDVFDIYRLTQPFDETTANWFNRPAIDTANVLQVTTGVQGGYTLISFDVSSLLISNGTSSTFGLMLSPVAFSGNAFATKESGPGYGAHLLAEYTTAVPEPSALLLLGVGVLVLLRRARNTQE